ncbi:MAG: hypothetical protein GW859_05270 [Sphingomonadales bacterium]|nr:hypothetical protein [Sphingomonadales bacterium]
MKDPRQVRATLAFVTLAMLFAALLLVAFGDVEGSDRELLLVLIGALVTNAKDALGFFFGTSQSSQEKSDLLARNGRSGGHET